MREERSLVKIKLPILVFLISRFAFLAATTVEGLRGYGDFPNFFNIAQMGVPYFDFWSEFPPIFPVISRVIGWVAAGKEHIYFYLLYFILTVAQAVSLMILLGLAGRIYGDDAGLRRGWLYAGLLLGLAYSWWYFDPLAVMLLLLGLVWVMDGKVISAGVAIGVGILVKLFPGLLLVVAWRSLSLRKALIVTVIAGGIVLLVYGPLMIASPQMTTASLLSQGSKGSWETVWALIDGNFQTGNFGPLIERFDPAAASTPRGNPARIPSWLTLVVFAGLGMWIFLRTRPTNDHQKIAFLGTTWGLFLLWSPGYSPQWVLYLLPIILLLFPEREALLFGCAFIIVNLLEWPVLLSRGCSWGLWLTIPLRTILLILFTFASMRYLLNKELVRLIQPVQPTS